MFFLFPTQVLDLGIRGCCLGDDIISAWYQTNDVLLWLSTNCIQASSDVIYLLVLLASRYEHELLSTFCEITTGLNTIYLVKGFANFIRRCGIC